MYSRPKSETIVDAVIASLSIPENAEFYNQGTFISEHFAGEDVCDTECCLAGWMVAVAHPKKYAQAVKSRSEGSAGAAANTIDETARILMTLKNGERAETHNLFIGNGGYWAGKAGVMFIAANSDKRKEVKAAIQRLKQFKETGE